MLRAVEPALTPRPNYAGGIEKRRFRPENASRNVFRSHYAGGIWKRRPFHPENASNVFRSHYAGEFENGGFTLKTHQMFSVHTTRGNLKTKVSVWKRIKCFPFTLRRRNLKTEAVSPWKRIKCFPFTLRRRNLKTEVSPWNASNVFRSHFAGEIWKHNSERSGWICVWGKLGQGNHVTVVTSSFSRRSVFKMISVHMKRKSRRLPFEERFRKVPFSWRISEDGRWGR